MYWLYLYNQLKYNQIVHLAYRLYQMVINKDFTQKKRRMRKLFSVAIIIVATMFANIAIAQNITGKVTDEQNHPFPYVNVLLQRADSSYIAGTITAEDGTFTIKSSPEGCNLFYKKSYYNKYYKMKSLH